MRLWRLLITRIFLAAAMFWIVFLSVALKSYAQEQVTENDVLVELECGYHFRASIADAIAQWKLLSPDGPRDGPLYYLENSKMVQLQEKIQAAEFFSLPGHCGKVDFKKPLLYVITIQQKSMRRRVEVLNLDEQPPDKDVARFKAVWDLVYERCCLEHPTIFTVASALRAETLKRRNQ